MSIRKLRKNIPLLKQAERIYGLKIPIIGLTGGIATGKSTVSKKLVEMGHTVICADNLVKKIYEKPITLGYVKKVVPEAIKEEGGIDFNLLREVFFNNFDVKQKLEQFLYSQLPECFLNELSKTGEDNHLIYDVPLLFEKKIHSKVDISVCVYSSQDKQLTRVMQRDGVSKESAERIINSQINIEDKKSEADYVIDNSGSIDDLIDEIDRFRKKFFK